VEAHFSLFGDSTNLDTKIGSRFGLNVPWPRKPCRTQRIELLGDMGHLESHFDPFRDSVSDGARQVHGLRQSIISSEIVLDAPDDTPRLGGSSGSSFQSVWR
jgi:hypothetical protein